MRCVRCKGTRLTCGLDIGRETVRACPPIARREAMTSESSSSAPCVVRK